VNESFLTVHEVAELLKLNQQTVRNWIRIAAHVLRPVAPRSEFP
jgi:excisionase family DNA binding protein